MGGASELYQSVILDHNKSPRNFRVLEDATHHAKGHNPLCGDQLDLWLRLEGDRIAEVTFQGQGCAISKASASLLTQAVQGKTRAEALELFERIHALLTGRAAPDGWQAVGKLQVFEGVAQFPVRVKCASLGWHTLKAALEQPEATASTE